jgi:hypothetical protein
MDPLKWILKWEWVGSHDSNLEPYDQGVTVGKGWVGRFRVSAVYQLLGCQMSKRPTGYIRHWQALPGYCYVTLKLIWLIHKLCKK